MSIISTGKVLRWHQTSHRNRVTIKVALVTPKVLVEAHGSRVGFVHPNDGDIYSGPSRWYHVDTACKHVTRSQGCHITERVKITCRKRDRTRYSWYRWSDRVQVKYRETKGIGYDVYGSHDHKVIVEYVGVITDLQIPLLTIDQRGVSIMSALFANRRVTHLILFGVSNEILDITRSFGMVRR